MRNAKKEYHATKILNSKTNPKHAWKTVNDVLGRSQNKILLMKLTYQGKQLHQLENWLMFLRIILPMLVPHLLKKSNMNTPVAFGISFLNMNQMRNSFSSLQVWKLSTGL